MENILRYIEVLIENDNIVYQKNPISIENGENTSCKKSTALVIQLKQEVDK